MRAFLWPPFLAFLLLWSSCGKSPEEARGKLAEFGIPYTPESYIQRVKDGDAVAVSLFMRTGMSAEARDSSGDPVLVLAARGGHASVVKLLLENGADENTTDSSGSTAVMVAAQNGSVEVIKILLSAGADINAQSSWGGSALSYAAREGRKEAIAILLARGADLQKNGGDALCAALAKGHAEIVELLLKTGVDPNSRSGDGHQEQTVLMCAAGWGESRFVHLLLSEGAEVNLATDTGQSALLSAAISGHADIVTVLLDNGADPNQRTSAISDQEIRPVTPDETARFWNLYKNPWNLYRVNSDAQDFFRRIFHDEYSGSYYDEVSPLLVAVKEGHTETVRALLKAGADPTIKDRRGRTPLMWAALKLTYEETPYEQRRAPKPDFFRIRDDADPARVEIVRLIEQQGTQN